MKITYDGNENENYSLLADGVIVAELLTGEDGAKAIVKEISILVNSYVNKKFVIQNDNDKLGVIVDVYDTNDEWYDGETYWFDEFND